MGLDNFGPVQLKKIRNIVLTTATLAAMTLGVACTQDPSVKTAIAAPADQPRPTRTYNPQNNQIIDEGSDSLTLVRRPTVTPTIEQIITSTAVPTEIPTEVPIEISTPEYTQDVIVNPEQAEKEVLPYNWETGSDQMYMTIHDENNRFIGDFLFGPVQWAPGDTPESLLSPTGNFAVGNNTGLESEINYDNVLLELHSGDYGPDLAPLQAEIFREIFEGELLRNYNNTSDISPEQMQNVLDQIHQRMRAFVGKQMRLDQGTGKDLIRGYFRVAAVAYIPHEDLEEYETRVQDAIDVAQEHDPIGSAEWEKAKKPGVKQYLVISLCGWGPLMENGTNVYSRYIILFEIVDPPEP